MVFLLTTCLEGMKGAADRNPKNGVVTVGELFEYVRENVQRATENKQHPCVGTNSYDRNLPVAITAGISAQEHYELGCQLYQIGLKLDDQYCLESAGRHLREAIRQAAVVGGKLPEAHLQLGLVLTASGKLPNKAIEAFEEAIEAGLLDADYYLGIAYLNQGEIEPARQYLEAFLNKQPDSDKTDPVQELISWFDASISSHPESVNRYALLIGINYSDNPKVGLLKGPVNDIEILSGVLSQKYNFKIRMLPDMEATYENIVNAFRELQELTSARDVVIIYYGGHGSCGNLIASDMRLNDEGDEVNVIGSNELYHFIDVIPSLHKQLILDTDLTSDFESFIKRVSQTKLCSLLLSTSLGQHAHEFKVEDTQKQHGYFTYTLVQELQQASEEILRQDLFERVKKAVQSRLPHQTPFFFGDLGKPLFFANLEQCPELFTFSQRRCYSAFDDRSLQSLHQKVSRQFTAIFPDCYYSLGLAFLEKGNNTQALSSLKTAVQYAKQQVEEKLISLGVSQFKNQLYTDALQTFQKCSETSTSCVTSDLLGNVISAINSLTKSKRCCALLVGIDTYLNTNTITSTEKQIPEPDDPLITGESIIRINGAPVNDTLVLRSILINKCDFQSEDIRILLNEEATHENILTAFQELVATSQTTSTLFYFAGRGSNDNQDNPTILAFDSRSKGTRDIQLTELACLANHKEVSLLSIIDSSWTDIGLRGTRYTEPDETIYPSSRKMQMEVTERDRGRAKIPIIGTASIYPGLIRYGAKNTQCRDGCLTSELIQFLKTNSLVTATYQKLLHFFVENIYFSSDSTDILQQTLFSNYVLDSKVRASLTKMEQEPIRHTVLILQRLIEQRNGADPEELFNLGIAYYRLKEYEKSIVALQTAIDQVSGQNSRNR